MGRSLVLGIGTIAMACSVSFADEPRTAEPVAQDQAPLFYTEPGPTVTASRDFDGVTEQVQTQRDWKPMCGSNMGNMTQEQFADFIRTIKANNANTQYQVLDNPTPHGTGLNIIYQVSNASAAAQTAITAVENYLEPLFADPIDVTITIDFQALGAGVLGATGSASTNVSYATARNALINGQDGNDTLQDFLPANSVPVKFNGSAATITNVTTIKFNTANYRAAIGAIAATDANMTISTNFAFDYDPSNGVTGGQTCFRSVLVHETLHALGFVSQGDGSGTTLIDALDLFRFRRTADNPATTADFTTFPRAVWTTNRVVGDANTDLINAVTATTEYRMSVGGGTDYQASHFQNTNAPPATAIGIMEPAIGSGVSFQPNYLRTSDLAALDAIGWDYPAVIVDTTPPTPNPMQFNTLPAAVNSQAITMIAAIATDTQHNSITYLFDYVGLLPGADDSAWQSSIVYTDTGLTENTSYSYRVKARDNASPPVETLFSPTAAAITLLNAPTGVNASNVTPTSATISAVGTLTNINLGNSGIYFSWVLTSGGIDVGNSGWVQVNSQNVTGLSPDTLYTFRAKARNQESIETSTNQSPPVRTLAYTPGAPTVVGTTLNVNPNGNPATVLYAIQCVSTVPNDPAWLNQYADITGAPSFFEDYEYDADWGALQLTGLTNGVTYQFAVKAVNSDFVETPLGPPAIVTTGSTTVHADCNGNGVFEIVSDTACFVDVLLGVNVDSGAITRSDVNADSLTNGRDISYFVNCALTGCP